jgi:hypothetical protein
VRRRVQQERLNRRGHKDDPLYKIRSLPRHGLEHLTDRQRTRLEAGLRAGDWLNGQSFADQYEYGMDVLQKIGQDIRSGSIK